MSLSRVDVMKSLVLIDLYTAKCVFPEVQSTEYRLYRSFNVEVALLAKVPPCNHAKIRI